jgi:hypothetical protein
MTDNVSSIAELKARPPVVTRTWWDWVQFGVGWLAGLFAVFALVVAFSAAARARETASCINTNLGQRAASSSADSKAHIAYAAAVNQYAIAQQASNRALAVVLAAKPGSEAQQTAFHTFVQVLGTSGAVLDKFVTVTGTYVATLEADQAYRDAHPLGRC